MPTATPASPITITYSASSVFSVTLPGANNGCTRPNDFTDTFTASEPGVTSFTATSANTVQVTVARSTATPTPQGAVPFVATEPMTNTDYSATQIVVTDPSGNTATAVVEFDVTCLNGNARVR